MMGEDDKALPFLLKDLERAKEEYDANHIDFAGNYANIGNIYLRQGRVALARDLLQSALDISILNLGEKALEKAIHYNNLGNVYRHIPKYKESLKNYKKSIDIIIEVEGDEHPHLIGGYNNIGEIHSQLKEYKQALYFLEKSLKLNIKIFNNEKHPNIGYVYGNIGLVYDGMKKYEKAYDYTKIAIEIFENNFSEIHPDLITSKRELERIAKKINQKSLSTKIPKKFSSPCGSGKKYKNCCEKNT